MIDRTASTVSLARTILAGIDPSKIETPVQTAALKLLLETLIDLGSGDAKLAEAARRSVMGKVAERTP